ncbi:phycobiliprotein lyase, partial [Synechococcus sp. AH-603-L18]
IMAEHWKRYGRHYYSRHDYEAVASEAAHGLYDRLEAMLPSLIGQPFAGRSGTLLRDLGYAEKAPATSTFQMDQQDGLILCTSYETMTVWERFWFTGPNVRLRSSTVEGLSNNASFCMETRLSEETEDITEAPAGSKDESLEALSAPFGW